MNPRSTVLSLQLLFLAPAIAGAQHWQIEAAPGGVLEVDLRTGGSVEIRGGGGSSVTIDAEVGGADADAVEVQAVPIAHGVRVRSEYTRKLRRSSASADLTIVVPDRFDLDLDSMGGGLRVTGVEGRLEGETMGGAIVLHQVKGRVSLSTMGGEIEVTDSEAEGKVSTMGGDVRFHNVRGGLQGSSMGGQVRIDEPDDAAPGAPHRVKITTMGGPIHLKSAPGGAEVSTMGGDVEIESAAGPVNASTMGGAIVIGGASSDVVASTMGGDVKVRVVPAGGDVDLESNSGDIELTLPNGFSATFELEVAFTRNSKRAYEIRSDFPLEQHTTADWSYDEGSPRKYIRGAGKSAQGAHRVKVRTINGDIVIHQGG